MPIVHSAVTGADPRLRDYQDLTDVALRSVREPEEGIYIAESLKVLERALRAGHRPLSALTTTQWLERLTDLCDAYPDLCGDMPIYVGSDEVLESITGFHVHRGTLASIARPALPRVRVIVAGRSRVVVLENIVSESCADPLYRRSVRVSMGTVMQVPWTRAGAWDDLVSDLRTEGFEIAALALSADAIALDDFARRAPERLALVLGTEGDGLSQVALESANCVVSIPMRGDVDSLNVAAASAVAMWALR